MQPEALKASGYAAAQPLGLGFHRAQWELHWDFMYDFMYDFMGNWKFIGISWE